jgi:hypothetical protein
LKNESYWGQNHVVIKAQNTFLEVYKIVKLLNSNLFSF